MGARRFLLSGCLFLLLGGVSRSAETPAAASASAFAPADSYQVTVLGDLHFDGEEFHQGPAVSQGRARERARNLAMWKGPSHQLLETAAGQTAGSSAFVIQLGDIAQGDCETGELQEAMLRGAFAAVKKYFPERPLLVVKGNRDVRRYKTQNDPAPAKNALLPLVAGELGTAVPEDGCFAVRKGKDLFIAADGFVGAKRLLEFVSKTLADHPDCRYVFFLTHLPLLPVGKTMPFWLVPGYDELAALLEKRHAVVLAAHTHTFSLVRRKNPQGTLAQLITTSMGNTWNPEQKLEGRGDYAAYVALVEAKEKVRERFSELMARGEYSGQFFKARSGFTVLDIDDRRVEARIYTGNTGKPAFTAVLTERVPAAK